MWNTTKTSSLSAWGGMRSHHLSFSDRKWEKEKKKKKQETQTDLQQNFLSSARMLKSLQGQHFRRKLKSKKLCCVAVVGSADVLTDSRGIPSSAGSNFSR
ncbi:unnamed protein product [Anisakis simplex]|uniref:Ovule protein n=1 Tax=Anisakis simplex TaxID=6269 RepID=A0A0M3J105_ANISI|nr:unnamed protein product [Anisakis simplex]